MVRFRFSNRGPSSKLLPRPVASTAIRRRGFSCSKWIKGLTRLVAQSPQPAFEAKLSDGRTVWGTLAEPQDQPNWEPQGGKVKVWRLFAAVR